MGLGPPTIRRRPSGDGDSEEEIGKRRMYEELRQEEIKHVEKFKSFILHWEEKLRQLDE